jgi:hypothetical protein
MQHICPERHSNLIVERTRLRQAQPERGWVMKNGVRKCTSVFGLHFPLPRSP